MNASFAAMVVAVSGGIALAATTLVEGWGGDEPALLVAGLILGAVSLVGIVVLARVVVLDQRRGKRR